MSDIYIHTINGEPAAFDGDQLCFILPRQPGKTWARGCKSRAEIEKQQAASRTYRLNNGMSEAPLFKYSYVRIQEPGE